MTRPGPAGQRRLNIPLLHRPCCLWSAEGSPISTLPPGKGEIVISEPEELLVGEISSESRSPQNLSAPEKSFKKGHFWRHGLPPHDSLDPRSLGLDPDHLPTLFKPRSEVRKFSKVRAPPSVSGVSARSNKLRGRPPYLHRHQKNAAVPPLISHPLSMVKSPPPFSCLGCEFPDHPGCK
eukprot:765203-Hanusia_phi.AAC.8